MSVDVEPSSGEKNSIYTYALRMTPEQHAEIKRRAARANTTVRALILGAVLEDPHLDVPTRMGRPPKKHKRTQEALPESA